MAAHSISTRLFLARLPALWLPDPRGAAVPAEADDDVDGDRPRGRHSECTIPDCGRLARRVAVAIPGKPATARLVPAGTDHCFAGRAGFHPLDPGAVTQAATG